MKTSHTAPSRGRPRTLTRERIADAGIAMGLPHVTVVGIAARLGVSHMALYKHFSGLDALKQLIAEEIFLRWSLPPLPEAGSPVSLKDYLTQFSVSMWQLVEQHTGIGPYMLRHDMITPAMLATMDAHQQQLASRFSISIAQSHWLFFTVAYHCIAVADTVLPLAASNRPTSHDDATIVPSVDEDYEKRVRKLYALGSQALIGGALAMLHEVDEAI